MPDPDWFKRSTPGPPRQPKPGEFLFEFHVERTHTFYRVELRVRLYRIRYLGQGRPVDKQEAMKWARQVAH